MAKCKALTGLAVKGLTLFLLHKQWTLFHNINICQLSTITDDCEPYLIWSAHTGLICATNYRRLRGFRRSLARRSVSAEHNWHHDVLSRLYSVVRLRRRRLRERRQFVLVPRRAVDVPACRGGVVRSTDTPQTRLLCAVVTSRAPARCTRRRRRRRPGSRRRSTCARRPRRHTRRWCSASADEKHYIHWYLVYTDPLWLTI